MNNAKIWLVVSPTVGVPLFLSAVAVGSFAVHVAVLSKTHWYEDYLVGKPLGTTATALLAVPSTEPANAAYLAPGSQDVTIVMPDGSTAHAVLQAPHKAGILN